MNPLITTILLTALSISVQAASPYSGQETRDIKALSKSDIEGYLKGKGMGFAKAAELNNYPGPKHVLDLASQLQLDPQQLEQTQALYESMKATASELGKQLVDKEQQLDRLYANGMVDNESLNTILLEIGSLQTRIRYVHLQVHLQQRKLLSDSQTDLYRQLRGYDQGHKQEHSHSHKMGS